MDLRNIAIFCINTLVAHRYVGRVVRNECLRSHVSGGDVNAELASRVRSSENSQESSAAPLAWRGMSQKEHPSV